MAGFQKATKKAARLRLALIGPSGSGKTFSALRIARGLVGPNGRVAVGDTENESASKYADRFEFDAQSMTRFSPRDFIALIDEAAREKYDCLIIDSLSHAWMGKGGALEMVDQVAKQSKSKNSFDAWRSVTPEHNAMVDALIRAPMHLIVTMRVKTEYVIEEVNGKKTPRKVGLAPVQRDGLEYEFDVVADMDGAELVVTKTRCPAIQKAVIIEPGEKLGETLGAWLTDGVPLEPPPPPPTPAQRNPNAVVGFGGAKGRKVSELSDLELADAIDLANLKLREEPSARWAKAMQDNLLLLEAELVHRAAGGSQPPAPPSPAPEPGQDG